MIKDRERVEGGVAAKGAGKARPTQMFAKSRKEMKRRKQMDQNKREKYARFRLRVMRNMCNNT